MKIWSYELDKILMQELKTTQLCTVMALHAPSSLSLVLALRRSPLLSCFISLILDERDKDEAVLQSSELSTLSATGTGHQCQVHQTKQKHLNLTNKQRFVHLHWI